MSSMTCENQETLHHTLNHCNHMLEWYLDPSTAPTDVAITAQKPDLLIVNSKDMYVTLFELSVRALDLTVRSGGTG